MTGKHRVITLIAAVTVLFAMLFSFIFITAEADHECSGDDCPVCWRISICEDALRSSFIVCRTAAVSAFTCIFASALLYSSEGHADLFSLVALKVKLSD